MKRRALGQGFNVSWRIGGYLTLNIDFGQNNILRGTEFSIMEVNNIKCAVMICFESTIPSLSSKFVNLGAEILVYLVNDGWYTTLPEPGQHAKQSVFRAIENRLPVIRCTNTGISMLVNPSGKVENSIGLNKAGTMQVKINKNKYGKTFYTRFGNVFSLILLGLIIILIIKSNIYEKK